MRRCPPVLPLQVLPEITERWECYGATVVANRHHWASLLSQAHLPLQVLPDINERWAYNGRRLWRTGGTPGSRRMFGRLGDWKWALSETLNL